MKKQIKKLTLFATIIVLGTAGFKIKTSKENSKIFNVRVEGYDKNFQKDPFDIIAHRGFSSIAVENSKEAITLAADEKYIDGIEMDLRLTKDKKIVLSHTDFVTTDNLESVQISDSTLKDLKETPLYHISNSFIHQIRNLFNTTDGTIITNRQNNLENKKYHLISLKEGLQLAKDKQIFLDLKFQDNYEEFSKELEKELEGKSLKNILFQSEDLLSLLKLKKQHPEYQCLALIKHKENLRFASYFDQIGIKKTLANQKEVKQEIENGKKISIWVVNTTNDIDNIITELGEEAKNITYITDYPDTIGMYLEDKFPTKKETTKQKKKK